MTDDEPRDDDRAQTSDLSAEFMKQLERVGVDLRAAHPRMRELEPPVERWISDEEVEVSITLDASGILETLRQLPDGAGTDAFVAAYNARFRP